MRLLVLHLSTQIQPLDNAHPCLISYPNSADLKKKKRVGEFFSSCFSFELPTMYSHSVSSSVFCYCRLLLLPLRVGKQLAIMWQLFLAWLYAPSQDKHVYHCTPNSHNVSYKRFGDSMWIENMITKCCEKGSSVCSAKNFFFFFLIANEQARVQGDLHLSAISLSSKSQHRDEQGMNRLVSSVWVYCTTGDSIYPTKLNLIHFLKISLLIHLFSRHF